MRLRLERPPVATVAQPALTRPSPIPIPFALSLSKGHCVRRRGFDELSPNGVETNRAD